MFTDMPQINYEKCNNCGVCITVCSCRALILEKGIVKFDKANRCGNCERWCCNCEIACPREAISCPFEIVIEK